MLLLRISLSLHSHIIADKILMMNLSKTKKREDLKEEEEEVLMMTKMKTKKEHHPEDKEVVEEDILMKMMRRNKKNDLKEEIETQLTTLQEDKTSINLMNLTSLLLPKT